MTQSILKKIKKFLNTYLNFENYEVLKGIKI